MADPVKADESAVAKADYDKKFGGDAARQLQSRENSAVDDDEKASDKSDVKAKENTTRGAWKTTTDAKKRRRPTTIGARIKGAVRNKSAFAFILVIMIGGIFYSWIFAPNILLVNMKDLYTNDLADATTALAAYTPKMIGYEIGKADCGDKDTINCKLSTMSRAMVQSMQKHGFTVVGSKLQDDGRDGMSNSGGSDKPESRWNVSTVVFPNGVPAIDEYSYALVAGSDPKIEYLANGVWNPRSSYFQTNKYKHRILSRFNLTPSPQVYGDSVDAVNQSFDSAMQGSDEQVDCAGQGAYSLKTLGSTGLVSLLETATGMVSASQPTCVTSSSNYSDLTTNNGTKIADAATPGGISNFQSLQCALWTQTKVALSAEENAKMVTLARFAMIYLQAADQIKSGTADEITTNALAGKLAASSGADYNGANATDSSPYQTVVFGKQPIPDPLSLIYSSDFYDALASILPGYAQVASSASSTGQIAGASGTLLPPSIDTLGLDQERNYCLSGETTHNKQANKPNNCPALVLAANQLLSGALQQPSDNSRHVCPPPNLNFQNSGVNQMMPVVTPVALPVMTAVAGTIDAGVAVWSNLQAAMFNHSTEGVAAGNALFAGTGIILGDMAQSYGMEPANAATLVPYLAEKQKYQQQLDNADKYAASQQPFDIYNKFSFAGRLVRSLNFSQASSGAGILSSLAGIFSAIPASVTSSAHAIYNLQPDPFNPLRLSCMNPQYLSIGIMADMACNVRYALTPVELNMQPKMVLDYMEKSHSDLTQKNIQELQTRLGQADTSEANQYDHANVARMLRNTQDAANQPEISKKTGAAIPNSEYDKFLTYCVNRQDPWGVSGLAVVRGGLSDTTKKKMIDGSDSSNNTINDNGDPYQNSVLGYTMSIAEGASADQDWYSGKKCLDQSEELDNFRAYTMMCSVDASFSGATNCDQPDDSGYYNNDFYSSNDILYVSGQ